MIIELETRNGVTPVAHFGVITIAMDHLSTAYLDQHHAELDKLAAEAAEIRETAIEAAKAKWSHIDMAGVISRLVVAIESAEDIETLKESDTFKTTIKKTLPLANVMTKKGTAWRLAKLERDDDRHTHLDTLWRVACAVEIKSEGKLKEYFGEDNDVQWPRVRGSAADKSMAIEGRVAILENLSVDDTNKLTKGLAKHIATANGLTEKEEGN